MAAILLVDDRPENLVALEAILEPLGHELVTAGSGTEPLRVLLRRDDFAVILLDAQMPQMDGFETATTIKQRERTRNIPIIFLTALSKDDAHVFRGYEVGAVDYVFKPLNAAILRNKVSVFVELYEKNEELHRQRELLALQALVAVRREDAQRFLLDAGSELARSLDYRETLARLAKLAVPRIADWCTVHLAGDDGAIVQLACGLADPAKGVFARELDERYPPRAGQELGV